MVNSFSGNFDGIDDYISTDLQRNNISINSGSSNDCTFSAWIKTTGSSNYSAVFGSYNLPSYFFIGIVNNTELIVQDGETVSDHVDISLNEWQHIAYVVRNNQQFLYLNGVETNLNSTIQPNNTENHPISIGYENGFCNTR